MTSGWFVFAVVTCIIICAGFVLAGALLRAAWAQKEREALSSTDLRALEESAVILIEQLKAEVDHGIEEIESRRRELASLLQETDLRIAELRELEETVRAAKRLAASDVLVRTLPVEKMDDAPMVEDSSPVASAEARLMMRISPLLSVHPGQSG